MESIISSMLLIVEIYLIIGIFFSIVFIWKGLEKTDDGIHGSSWLVKALIFPGMIVFWVVFANKWRKAIKIKS
jgi:hypothetical protein